MTEVYTESVVAKVVSDYLEVADKSYDVRSAVLTETAKVLGVSVASVRGKLVSAGVYKAKEAAKTEGSKGMSKDEYVKALEAISGVTLTSFSKATKKDLEAFWGYVVKATDKFDADSV